MPGRPGFVVLVCDRCGLEFGSGIHLRDWYVLWPVAARAGWRGEAEPFGTHACGACDTPSAAEGAAQ